MANKETIKVSINRERFMEALKVRKSSIRKLGEAYDQIGRTEKTIRRYLQKGEIPPDLLDKIGKFLDVEPDYIAGKYDRNLDKMKDEHLRSILRSQLKVDKFPYLMKQQEARYEGKFIYDKYFEYILIIHDISIRQFQSLNVVQQKSLQIDIEYAITSIIAKHFVCDAKGRKGLPNLHYWAEMIDSFNTDGPAEIIEKFTVSEDDDEFAEKYKNNKVGVIDNDN